MHLLYRGTTIKIITFRISFYLTFDLFLIGHELRDNLTLAESRIENGANLRLILALRGGPINTR